MTVGLASVTVGLASMSGVRWFAVDGPLAVARALASRSTLIDRR